MTHEIKLCGSPTKSISLCGDLIKLMPLPGCGQDKIFSVVVSGFGTNVVLELNASVIARTHGDTLDLQTSLAIGELIAQAMARSDFQMAATKNLRVEDFAVADGSITIAAEKFIDPGNQKTIAGVELSSFAYSIDIDDVAAECVARTELAAVALMRLRVMTDDADYMMTDDADLSLSDLNRIETG